MKEIQSKVEKEFESEDERFYFNHPTTKDNKGLYAILTLLCAIAVYIFYINWLHLNEYHAIKSAEKYPVEKVINEQIPFYGDSYSKFKEKSGVNNILSKTELEKYWNNCIGSCEIPSTHRFYLVSDKQEFINWVCNERIKENHYSATKYAVWKLNKQGCQLTNLEQIKSKDKEEIQTLKWQKQKEMEIYLAALLLVFLAMLHIIRKIIKNKKLK